MELKIRIESTEQSRISEIDMEEIPFGRVFSDHMLVSDYDGTAWTNTRVVPYGPIELNPASTVLHYGQEIFEGLKAYKHADGRVFLFRPKKNWERLNASARRMSMQELPEWIFMDGLQALVGKDSAWIPNKMGSSLYIRPFMIATDEYIGIRASDKYTFMIICCPVTGYYTDPIRVKIEEHYVRASMGGTGEAKTGGNYAASLYAVSQANKEGWRQMLWTDSATHEYFEESGTMNLFFVVDGKILTPNLNGNILYGVTRDSALTLFRDNGYEVEERPVRVDEIVQAAREGRLQEAFGTGTAATVAQFTHIGFRDETLELPPVEEMRTSNWLMETLDGIKYGLKEDPYGWLVEVK